MKKIKQKIKSIFKKMFDVKRAKSFDFNTHLEFLDFYLAFENDKFSTYQADDNDFLITVNKEFGRIRLIHRQRTLSELNFIPDSPMVLDIFVKLTIRNFENNSIIE